jgi:hypothetical protein
MMLIALITMYLLQMSTYKDPLWRTDPYRITQSRCGSRMNPAFALQGPVRESIAIMIVRKQILGLCGIILQLFPQVPDIGPQLLELPTVLLTPYSS